MVLEVETEGQLPARALQDFSSSASGFIRKDRQELRLLS